MIYIFLYLIRWIGKYELDKIRKIFYKNKITLSDVSIRGKYAFMGKIRPFLRKRKMLTFLGSADINAMVFFISPVLTIVKEGLFLGSMILFFLILMEGYIFFKIKYKNKEKR